MSDLLPNETFQLGTDVIADEDLQVMYHELRNRITEETSLYAGFPTVQQLLVERACLLYVQMRQAERNPGSIGPRASVQMTREWLLILQEIAKQASAKQDPERIKAKIVEKITAKLVDAIDIELPDPVQAAGLKEKLAEYLENAQL